MPTYPKAVSTITSADPIPIYEAKAVVIEAYRRHKGRYGQRRIGAVLPWSKKKVQRMMRLLGLKAKVRHKKAYRPQAMGETSANILKRKFTAEKSGDK